MRRAEPPDVAPLAELERDVFPRGHFGGGAWSEDALRDLISSDRGGGGGGVGSLVLVEPGEPIPGYAAFRTVLDEAELLRVAVRPEARRRGLGRRLLEHGFEILAADGVVTCHLEVREDNLGAIRLYEALGFERVGRRPSYYADGCDALLFSGRPASESGTLNPTPGRC